MSIRRAPKRPIEALVTGSSGTNTVLCVFAEELKSFYLCGCLNSKLSIQVMEDFKDSECLDVIASLNIQRRLPRIAHASMLASSANPSARTSTN